MNTKYPFNAPLSLFFNSFEFKYFQRGFIGIILLKHSIAKAQCPNW